MTGAVATMAARIESDIVERTTQRVDAALAQARDASFQAYADALRPVCGRPFDVKVVMAMSEAEAALRKLAIEHATRIETDNVLRRLGAP